MDLPPILGADQLECFDRDGYLVLRDWIPAPMLDRLREAAAGWIEKGADHPDDPDFVYAGETMWRVDYLHGKGSPASLELLGSPAVLGVAESMCGPDFVPTYESLVFKHEGNGAPVQWHQDAVHPRRWRIFNFDLYLDDSRSGAGALWVIPGSQLGRRDACAIAEDHGWMPPGAVEVEMAAGDVLLHDVMVVHGSPGCEGNALRRTIYYEFRAAAEILADGPWDRTWIDRRMRLVPLGIEAHRARYPDTPGYEWRASPEYRPDMTGDPEVELRIAHLVHMNGSWCSAGSVA
jgi:hypothetical protein